MLLLLLLLRRHRQAELGLVVDGVNSQQGVSVLKGILKQKKKIIYSQVFKLYIFFPHLPPAPPA